jgi:2-(1,2-epoxy-1,2-dihydrophenyl)acetyl-CoA isomerase
MELLLLGDTIDAQEALRIGLVNRVVPHDELAAATSALAARLAELPAQAMGRIKGLVHRAQSTDLETALEAEALALGEAFTSADHRAAVAAFAERRRQRAAGRS